MSFNISYIFTAIDKYSEVAKGISRQTEVIAQKVDLFNKKLEKTSEHMKKTGEAMSLYLGLPIAEFARESVIDFNKVHDSITLFKVGFKNAGATVGLTFDQINDNVNKLFENSEFSKQDLFQQMTSQMFVFKHVTGQVFLDAQQSIVNYAAYSKKGLQGSTMAIGRALESIATGKAERGLMALKRTGVIFTDQQTKIISYLSKTGHVMEAQELVLKRLNKTYQDSAAALENASAYKKFSKQMEEVKENVGEVVSIALEPLLEKINAAMAAFNHASPATRKWIIELFGAVGIIGPLILALSGLMFIFSALVKSVLMVTAAIRGLAGAFMWLSRAILANPLVAFIGLVIGIGAAAYYAGRKLSEMVGGPAGLARWLVKEFNAVTAAIKNMIGWIERIPFTGKGGSGPRILSTQAAGHPAQIAARSSLFHMPTLSKSFFQNPQPTLSKSLFQQPQPTFNLPQQQIYHSPQQSHATINVNVVDKSDMVKSIESSTKGQAKVNVGRNMAHIG